MRFTAREPVSERRRPLRADTEESIEEQSAMLEQVKRSTPASTAPRTASSRSSATSIGGGEAGHRAVRLVEEPARSRGYRGPTRRSALHTSIEAPDKANAFFIAGLNLKLRDDDPDYPALVLGNYMLGGGFLNSRLAVRIRQKEGLWYGVGSQFQASALDQSGRSSPSRSTRRRTPPSSKRRSPRRSSVCSRRASPNRK